MQVTIAMPVVLLVLLVIFAAFQLRSPWPHMRKTFDEVRQKLILILSFSFSVLSIFFLKTIVQGFVCNGDNFLHSQPEIVCDTSLCDGSQAVCYSDVVYLASFGLCAYIAGAALIVAATIKFPDRFFFWSDKWCVGGLQYLCLCLLEQLSQTGRLCCR